MKWRNKLLMLAVLTTVGTGFMLVVGQSSASAAFGDKNYDGYFCGKKQTSGNRVVNEGVPGNINSANEYINWIQGLLNSSNMQKKTAGSYLIKSMLSGRDGGVCGNKNVSAVELNAFRETVRAYADAGRITWYWTTPSNFNCSNTFYQTSHADVADYSDCAGTRNQPAIAFFNDSNQVAYTLKRACANPLGGPDGIPKIPDWDLKGESIVNKPSAKRGEKVYFRHAVENEGPSTANYRWRVTEAEVGTGGNTSAWKNNGRPTGSPSNVKKGQKSPALNSSRIGFEIPENATIGKQFCQRIEYSNASGPGTRPLDGSTFGHSTRACVKVIADTPDPSVSNCEYLSVTNPDNFKVGPSEVLRNARTKVTTTNLNHNTTGKPVSEWITSAETKQWYLWASDSWGTVTIQRDWYRPASGSTPGKWENLSTTTNNYACYVAKCEVQVTGNVPGAASNAVKAGSNYDATVIIRNPARGSDFSGYPFPPGSWAVNNNKPLSPRKDLAGKSVPLNQGYSLSATQVKAGGNIANQINEVIAPGEYSDSVQLTLTAPATAGAATTPSFYADYYNHPTLGRLSDDCNTPINVYDEFTARPIAEASLTPTAENPNQFQYTGRINVTTTGGVKIPYTACSFKLAADASEPDVCPPGTIEKKQSNIVTFNPGMNTVLGTTSSNITNPVAGDKYCTLVTLSFSGGYVGNGGSIAGGATDGELTDIQCATIHNKPYFKAYGKGIRSGGGFSGEQCGQGGLLAGWNDYSANNGPNRGSGSQLSALALIKITGVASAQAQPGSANAPNKLTFANSGTRTTSPDSPALGGDFGGSFCFDDVEAPAGTGSIDGTPTVGTAGSQKYNAGNKTIAGGSVGNGVNQSIFIEGNVHITNNITYAPWINKSQVPSFVLRASGNIYIHPDVTQLDGLYIAGGKIFTCATNIGVQVNEGDLYGTCNRQLQVNGAFIATQINLMRTYGSLRDSVSGEGRTNPGNRTCSNPGSANNSTTCAAESFNFSPELYLSNPAIQAPNSGTRGYDSIVSLPPIL